MSESKTKIIAEVGIACALSVLLNFIPNSIAQTFYVEFALVPLLILSLRRGVKVGLLAGLLQGILVIIIGSGSIFQILQAFLDYILAPTCLGFAGLLKSRAYKTSAIISGCFLGVFAKYFWHFIAGIVFWGSYAWKGWRTGGMLILYSFITQGTSALLTSIFSVLVILFLYKSYPKIFPKTDKNKLVKSHNS